MNVWQQFWLDVGEAASVFLVIFLMVWWLAPDERR